MDPELEVIEYTVPYIRSIAERSWSRNILLEPEPELEPKFVGQFRLRLHVVKII
jgi:hypothetical protein